MPGAKATWEDWAKAAKEVATKVEAPFPLAHRPLGPPLLRPRDLAGRARCSTTMASPPSSTRASSERRSWSTTGTRPASCRRSSGARSSGTAYRGANDEFKNAQVVMYMSGSWQIGQFDKTIGDAFDWVAVPNPCGPANCSGMPGGAGLVAIKTTQHPEGSRAGDGISRQRDRCCAEFYQRSLFVPGHLGLAKKGLDYPTATPRRGKAALKVFTAKASPSSPRSRTKLQGYVNNRDHLQRRHQPARPGGRRRDDARRGLQAHHRRRRAADRRAQQEVTTTGPEATGSPRRRKCRPSPQRDAPDNGALARPTQIALLPVGVVLRLLDWPMRALQRVIGERRMAYVFLLPNLVFFGLFVFAADRHQRRLLGDRRDRAVSLASAPMSGPTSTPICSTAAAISIRRPAARTISGAASHNTADSSCSRSR